MFINFISRVTVSFGPFKISLGNPLFWAGIGCFVLLLWRWWGFKKLLSFCIVIFILVFLMFKLDVFIGEKLGEESSSFALLTKPLFMVLAAFIFLCYGFLWKD